MPTTRMVMMATTMMVMRTVTVARTMKTAATSTLPLILT